MRPAHRLSEISMRADQLSLVGIHLSFMGFCHDYSAKFQGFCWNILRFWIHDLCCRTLVWDIPGKYQVLHFFSQDRRKKKKKVINFQSILGVTCHQNVWKVTIQEKNPHLFWHKRSLKYFFYSDTKYVKITFQRKNYLIC